MAGLEDDGALRGAALLGQCRINLELSTLNSRLFFSSLIVNEHDWLFYPWLHSFPLLGRQVKSSFSEGLAGKKQLRETKTNVHSQRYITMMVLLTEGCECCLQGLEEGIWANSPQPTTPRLTQIQKEVDVLRLEAFLPFLSLKM